MTPALEARAIACLDERRRVLDGVVAQLAAGGEAITFAAVEATSNLPAIAACTDTAYVLAAGAAAPALGTFGKARALGGYASALVYLGLGLFTALTDPRPR